VALLIEHQKYRAICYSTPGNVVFVKKIKYIGLYLKTTTF